MEIKAIKTTRNTQAGGRHLYEGAVYRVPEEVTLQDARLLINIRKAVAFNMPVEPKPEESGNLLYPLEEALMLINEASMLAEIDEIVEGETRKEVLLAAEAKKKTLEEELEKESMLTTESAGSLIEGRKKRR